MIKQQKVLIVGAGFGGVKAALKLAEHKAFDVTLLSDDSNFRYYPTLYRTATGGTRANSSIPLSSLFDKLPVSLVKDRAISLDRKAKLIKGDSGKDYPYDTLILSLGVVTNYFGIEGLDEYAYGIKSQDEVAKFKKHLHEQIKSQRKPDLNYVIVGAGPTGIELAGSLGSYIKHIMKSHNAEKRAVHIDLIEAQPKLLPNMPKPISAKVALRLHKLGVRMYLNSKVEAETVDELRVSGRPIRSHTVIWTAGVTNHPFFKENNFSIMGRGKVGVDAYLQSEPNVFVLGDNANTPFSGMAQTAIHDGDFVANNLIRRADNKDFKSYEVKKPISVIPAGGHWAVVLWGKLRFSGYSGYLIREAADLLGFHDIEPWPKAFRQFLSEFSYEDDCPICAKTLLSS